MRDNIYSGKDGYYVLDRQRQFHGPYATLTEADEKAREVDAPEPVQTVANRLRIVLNAFVRGAHVNLGGLFYTFDDAGQLCMVIRKYHPPAYTAYTQDLRVCDVSMNYFLNLLATTPEETFIELAMRLAVSKDPR